MPSTSEAGLSWTSSGLDFLVHLDRHARGFGAALQRAVRDAIRSGRLHAGDPLPSTRALAGDLGVPLECGTRLPGRLWAPADCPLCAAGVPLERG